CQPPLYPHINSGGGRNGMGRCQRKGRRVRGKPGLRRGSLLREPLTQVCLSTVFINGVTGYRNAPTTATAPSTCDIRSAELGARRWIENLSPSHTADFGPDLEFLGPGRSVLGGSDMIAADRQ